MRVAFITDVIYPFVTGGAEKRVHETVKRLAGKHEVKVYCMQYWEGDKNRIEDGVEYRGVCGPIPLYTSGGRRRIWEALYFSIRLMPTLLFGRYDVVDVSQFPYFPILAARLVSWLRFKPLIVTWHEVWGGYWSEYLGPLGFFGQLVEWFCSKLPNRIIAVSEKTKRDLIGLGVSEKKIVVIPNGVNTREINSIQQSTEKYDVVYAGRLSAHKNVELILEAVSNLDGVSALILGDGPEKEKLVGIANELRILDRVEFRDFVDSQELYGILKSSRVFVLPSTREGFGISVVEANACGIAAVVVKHKNNAATDLVEDGVNGLVADFNAGAVTAKINTILAKPEGHYRRACKTKASGFEWDEIAEEIDSVHSEVAGGA